MSKTREDYKQMLEKIKKQTSSSSKFDYLELKDGPNVVRVLPGHPNMEGFFVEVFQHAKGNKETYMSVICLNHGDPRAKDCLIEDELEELRVSKDKADKAMYNDQKAKPRYYMNVVDRKTGECKSLPCGSSILKGILVYVTDEEYGDILDVNEGRDVTINKSGKGMDTEYTVVAKPKISPVFADEDEITELIGTSAEDTKLPDLTELKAQFNDEPDKALLVWKEGWKALKDADDDDAPAAKKAGAKSKATTDRDAPSEEDEDEVKVPLKSRCATCGDKRFKTPSTGVASCPAGHGGPQLAEGASPSKPSKAYLKEFPPAEPEAAAEPPKPLKSRCAVCGDKRFKYADGTISCAASHGGPQLAEGSRPTKPSKAYLKEFPEPVETVEEEEEEETTPKPKKSAGAATSSAVSPTEEDEGLDDLDEILKQHSKGAKK